MGAMGAMGGRFTRWNFFAQDLDSGVERVRQKQLARQFPRVLITSHSSQAPIAVMPTFCTLFRHLSHFNNTSWEVLMSQKRLFPDIH